MDIRNQETKVALRGMQKVSACKTRTTTTSSDSSWKQVRWPSGLLRRMGIKAMENYGIGAGSGDSPEEAKGL